MSETVNPVEVINNSIKQLKERLSWDDYFVSTALLIATRSSCERLHVGCVLVKDKRIIAAGYNGFLAGAPHTSCVVNNHEQNTVHAEQNAISDCAKRGVSTENATAYVTHFPCVNCAKILAASGIKEVKYHSDYKNSEIAINLLKMGNVSYTKLSN